MLIICRTIPTVGRCHSFHITHCIRENCMSRTFKIAVPATLLLSALVLSACASKSEPAPVAASAPVEVVAEKPAAPEPAPATVAATEQPQVSTPAAPKKAVKKAKKVIAKPAPPKAEPVPAPAPVVAPPPVVEYKAPPVVQPEPAPPVVVAPPAKEEPGFLAQYWMWLLGLVILIAAIVVWRLRSQND